MLLSRCASGGETPASPRLDAVRRPTDSAREHHGRHRYSRRSSLARREAHERVLEPLGIRRRERSRARLADDVQRRRGRKVTERLVRGARHDGSETLPTRDGDVRGLGEERVPAAVVVGVLREEGPAAVEGLEVPMLDRGDRVQTGMPSPVRRQLYREANASVLVARRRVTVSAGPTARRGTCVLPARPTDASRWRGRRRRLRG